MLDFFKNIDHNLFRLINQSWQNDFFDVICPIWRDKMTWIPLYMVLIIYAIYRYKKKVGCFLIATTLLMLAADTISSKLIKGFFQRTRPCNLFGEENINLLVNCSGGFSFTSSHATNHMAIATFISLVLLKKEWQKYTILIWAIFVGYSQIYVGVHFLGDVVAGLLLGYIIGKIVAYFTLKWTSLGSIK